jgi:hypothetical protein
MNSEEEFALELSGLVSRAAWSGQVAVGGVAPPARFLGDELLWRVVPRHVSVRALRVAGHEAVVAEVAWDGSCIEAPAYLDGLECVIEEVWVCADGVLARLAKLDLWSEVFGEKYFAVYAEGDGEGLEVGGMGVCKQGRSLPLVGEWSWPLEEGGGVGVDYRLFGDSSGVRVIIALFGD